MKELYISADGGGTKLNVFAFDTDGNITSFAREGGVNTNFQSEQSVCGNIQNALCRCLRGELPKTVYYSLVAGKSFFDEYLLSLGCEKTVLRPVSEGFSALIAGTLSDHGCAVLSGTGSGAAYYVGEHDCLHLGGYGAYIGDDGSGSWVGMKAINAVTSDVDGWGERTALTEKLFEYLGDDSLNPGLYKHEIKGRALYAGFAKTVKQTAEEGDAVAGRIMSEAGVLLARLTSSMLGKYFAGCRSGLSSKVLREIKPNGSIPNGIKICPCGGVWRDSSVMLSAFDRELSGLVNGYVLTLPEFEPVYAGYILHFLPLYGEKKTKILLKNAIKQAGI